MTSTRLVTLTAALTLSLAVGCKRNDPPAAPPPSTASQPPAPNPPTTQAVVVADASAAARADGPRQEITDPRYRIVAELSEGTGENPATLNVELRGGDGYHVNEQYPIALDLDVRNGQAPHPTMRRGDAAEFTQAVARFTTPVQGAGPGTEVAGRLRFAVCTAENCVPETRNFVVALR